ncbi:DHS-like NAD/FAD-binding domain-containing protein [Xylariaceae sp. FL0255]|nr:DHS-like NAD/FAD-binding domain-containing protein [Xylariaceae sp. FL0255]
MATQTAQPSPSTEPSGLDPAAVASFQAHLAQSKRIVAVLGAGLSVASGLGTFRGTGGYWRDYDVRMVATPAGWKRDPGLNWQFYAERRREALRAEPNPAHRALAALAKLQPGFVALSQNVDGLLQRCGMGEGGAKGQLKLLHGNLFDLRCAGGCGYFERDNFNDPLCPALGEGMEDKARNVLGARVEHRNGEVTRSAKITALLFEGIVAKNRKILGDRFEDAPPTAADAVPLKAPGEIAAKVPDMAPELHSGINKADLPQCPGCKSDLLRPAVVWFGEGLPKDVVEEVDVLFEERDKIDLCLVIGTSSIVWPAAGYAERARKKGARIAVVNTNPDDAKNVREGDWLFVGDAAKVVPEILGDYVH